MNNITIEISNIRKIFGDNVALGGVSTKFLPGNLYGVIGPAGAGKTTLFRIMLGLMSASAGNVTYYVGRKKMPFDNVRQDVAYMPQSQSLYSDLSVQEHLEFFRDLYGIGDKEYEMRMTKLVQMTRLENFLDMPAGNLSGGMYKKLGLMCALLRSPKVMLLDEPTNGVDPISRREFWDLLHESLARGILIIMSTAYMDEAERCGQVVLMEQGQILGTGEPQTLLRENNCNNFDEFFLKRGGKK